MSSQSGTKQQENKMGVMPVNKLFLNNVSADDDFNARAGLDLRS